MQKRKKERGKEIGFHSPQTKLKREGGIWSPPPPPKKKKKKKNNNKITDVSVAAADAQFTKEKIPLRIEL